MKIHTSLFNKVQNRLKRIFSKSKPPTLLIESIGAVNVAYDPAYRDIVRVYYLYCVELIKENLVGCNAHVNIIFGDYVHDFLNKNPVIRITFQIEHTLVKPGGRDSGGAKEGKISLNNNEKYLVRLVNLSALRNANVIIDYSYANYKNVSSSDVYPELLSKYHVLSPILYKYRRSNNERSLETITLFFNPEEPRRKSFLDLLIENKITTKNIRGHFDDLEQIYRNTKILINIRQTNYHDTLEELRVLPALLCGVIVICENSPLRDVCGYSDYILWADLNDMPKLIEDVQKNYTKYHQTIFNDSFDATISKLLDRNLVVAKQIVDGITKAIH